MPQNVFRFTLCLSLIVMLSLQSACAQETVTNRLPTAAAPPPPASIPGVLPKGTPVRFVLLDRVSSATAKKGQTVHFAVAEDVKDGEAVVIRGGTPAIGEVERVRRSIPGKQSAYLDLEPKTVLLANGVKLKVAQSPDQENCKVEPSCWVAIGWMGAVAAIFLPVDLTALAIHSIRHDRHASGHPVREDFERGPCEAIRAFTVHKFPVSTVSTPPHDSANDKTPTVIDACETP